MSKTFWQKYSKILSGDKTRMNGLNSSGQKFSKILSEGQNPSGQKYFKTVSEVETTMNGLSKPFWTKIF